MSSHVAASVKSWWRPSLRLPASQPLSQTVEQLNTWQPEVLIAYASKTGILAEEQLAQRLRIDPKVVYAASEIPRPQTIKRVREAWGDVSYSTNMSRLKQLYANLSLEHEALKDIIEKKL